MFTIQQICFLFHIKLLGCSSHDVQVTNLLLLLLFIFIIETK